MKKPHLLNYRLQISKSKKEKKVPYHGTNKSRYNEIDLCISLSTCPLSLIRFCDQSIQQGIDMLEKRITGLDYSNAYYKIKLLKKLKKNQPIQYIWKLIRTQICLTVKCHFDDLNKTSLQK